MTNIKVLAAIERKSKLYIDIMNELNEMQGMADDIDFDLIKRLEYYKQKKEIERVEDAYPYITLQFNWN